MKRGSGRIALKRKWTLKEYLAYFAPALVLTLASFAIAYQFVDPAPPRHITIATGQTSGAYYETAKKYSRVLARDGVTLYVKPTSGSAENLKLLADGNSGVDVVFVQGGVGASQFSDHFVSLGSLYFEPLWVFHRTEVPIVYLKDMRGSNI